MFNILFGCLLHRNLQTGTISGPLPVLGLGEMTHYEQDTCSQNQYFSSYNKTSSAVTK